MPAASSRLGWLIVAASLALGVRIALAGSIGLLADEAYYVQWSRALAWGYYDQPPGIALVLSWIDGTPPAALAVRAPALAFGAVGAAATAVVARARGVAVAWWMGVPALFGLTLFATPDAALLACWAGAIAAASVGGRAWLLAGVLAAAAVLFKHPGVLALPLAILALGPREWRQPWPWLGALLAGVLLVPHAIWLSQHDWVTLRFQLAEGLVRDGPGWQGPLQVVGEQLLVLGPLTAIALLRAAWWGDGVGWTTPIDVPDRAARIGLVTAIAVLGLFVLASPFGAPEAHWPAPAWVGLGFWAAQRERGGLVWAGLGLGAAASVMLGLIAAGPLQVLAPAVHARFSAGAELRAALDDLGPGPILSERYQEAALAEVLAGRDAVRPEGCGRSDQHDLWSASLPDAGWSLRPTTGGPAFCTDAMYSTRGPVRTVGRWQVRWVQRP